MDTSRHLGWSQLPLSKIDSGLENDGYCSEHDIVQGFGRTSRHHA